MSFKKLKNILRWLVLIGVIIFIGSFILKVQMIQKAKNEFSRDKTPHLYVTPISRKISSMGDESLNYQMIMLSNVKFRVPWGKGKILHTPSRGGARIYFDDITFMVSVNKDPISLYEIYLMGSPRETKELRKYFGKDFCESDYSLHKATLEITPDQLNIFTPYKKAKFLLTQLVLKLVDFDVICSEKVYTFTTDNVKGVQYNFSDQVRIEIYDENIEIFMVIRCKEIVQDEIDVILSSIEIF